MIHGFPLKSAHDADRTTSLSTHCGIILVMHTLASLMKVFALSALIVPLSTGTLAQENLLTPTMSCRQASALVSGQGAVVLKTGPYTYDRYVTGRQFCQIGERARPAWVPTADVQQCFVGNRCMSDRGQGR